MYAWEAEIFIRVPTTAEIRARLRDGHPIDLPFGSNFKKAHPARVTSLLHIEALQDLHKSLVHVRISCLGPADLVKITLVASLQTPCLLHCIENERVRSLARIHL